MEDRFQEKGEIIEKILDKIMPIPQNASKERWDRIDTERLMLVSRAGWNDMSVEKLTAILNKQK